MNILFLYIRSKLVSLIISLPEKFIALMPAILFQIVPDELLGDKFLRSKITKKDFLMIRKIDRLFEARIKDYREGKCDYLPLYNDIEIKEDINESYIDKFEYNVSGITRNYHGKGLFAVSIHATKSGSLLYAEGSMVCSADGSEILKDYDFYKILTPEEFVNLLKERQEIDLKKGGNTGDAPIYLICCHALLGDDSAAQRLANYTAREVYAHSEYSVLVNSIEAISNSELRKKTPVMLSFESVSDNEIKRIKEINKEKKRAEPKKHKDRHDDKLPKICLSPIIKFKRYHSRKNLF